MNRPLYLVGMVACAGFSATASAEMPTQAMGFGCRLYPDISSDARVSDNGSEFMLHYEMDAVGTSRFLYSDPENLLQGIELRHISEVNHSGDQDGQMWLIHSNKPAESTDLMFVIYPGAKTKTDTFEARMASLGRPIPGQNTMGTCYVFRGVHAASIRQMIEAKGQVE